MGLSLIAFLTIWYTILNTHYFVLPIISMSNSQTPMQTSSSFPTSSYVKSKQVSYTIHRSSIFIHQPLTSHKRSPVEQLRFVVHHNNLPRLHCHYIPVAAQNTGFHFRIQLECDWCCNRPLVLELYREVVVDDGGVWTCIYSIIRMKESRRRMEINLQNYKQQDYANENEDTSQDPTTKSRPWRGATSAISVVSAS